MTGMPQADAAEFPSSDDLPQRSSLMQESFPGSEGEFVNSVSSEVVPNVVNARSFVARKTVDVFGSARLSAPHGPVVDRMRERVAGLHRKTAVEPAFQRNLQTVIGA
jgi:hypothetical protein